MPGGCAVGVFWIISQLSGNQVRIGVENKLVTGAGRVIVQCSQKPILVWRDHGDSITGIGSVKIKQRFNNLLSELGPEDDSLRLSASHVKVAEQVFIAVRRPAAEMPVEEGSSCSTPLKTLIIRIPPAPTSDQASMVLSGDHAGASQNSVLVCAS